MIIEGKKEYLYKKCEGCLHAEFAVAQGLHPDYGWWYQVCNLPEECGCKPKYEYEQLKLF